MVLLNRDTCGFRVTSPE